MSSLRESARSLFSFQNPFNERTASSSDETVLTGTATREAIEETKSFVITSYSIHYTKLYDPSRRSLTAPPTM